MPVPEARPPAPREPPPPEARVPLAPPPTPGSGPPLLVVALGALALLVLGAAVALGASALLGEDEAPAPAPVAAVDPEARPEVPAELGFPAFATQNTTRIAGQDPIADAAGAALARYPTQGAAEGPAAVALVDSADWQGGIAAAALAAPPIGAPLLITDSGEVPALTLEALRALAPQGSRDTDGAQALRIGDATVPDGLRTTDAEGAEPAELAAEIDALRRRLTGRDPDSIVIASSEDPGFAMPAAAWAAFSGDPVLFVERDSVPAATLRALDRHRNARAYVLGSEQVVSDRVLRRLSDRVAGVRRVAGESPVTNAITFARFADGAFGWNINDPGHGFVIANQDRPLDAAAAAPLSAAGKPGPLLLTDDAETVPGPLRGFLLDTKPGFRDDPTRAVYNHVWLIGDQDAISVPFQAEVDELTALSPILEGSGDSLGPQPGSAESEPEP